jgi:hypothetical protein
MNSLLLDTTILEARTIKVPVLSETVAATISLVRRTGAAEYAILEYHNAVVQATDHLIALLKEKRDLDCVREHVDRISGASYALRRANMYREILNKLAFDLRTNFDPYYNPSRADFQEARAERAGAILREFQRTWVRELHTLIDGWERGTGCYWVRQLESMTRSQRKLVKVRCSASNVRCRLPEFLAANRQNLEAMEKHVASLAADEQTQELRRLVTAFRQFSSHPESATEYSTGCRCFADALHVLAANAYDAIYSMNYREFGPLCLAVRKRFVCQDHRGHPPQMGDAPKGGLTGNAAS